MNVLHHQLGRDILYKTWHSDHDNMIIYFYSNGGNIVFQDKIYPIEEGTICFISANKQHYTMPSDTTKYDRSKIFVSQEIFENILKLSHDDTEFYNLFKNNSVLFAKIPQQCRDKIEEIYMKAELSIKKEISQADFICQYLNLMIYLKNFSSEYISMKFGTITKSIEYINRNFHLPISLNDICKEMHMSKYYFCRKFKSQLGTTVMQYLLNTRIAAAKTAIVTENISISEISEKCGFSSFSYFCQIFKKQTGKTPSEYKKASRK